MDITLDTDFTPDDYMYDFYSHLGEKRTTSKVGLNMCLLHGYLVFDRPKRVRKCPFCKREAHLVAAIDEFELNRIRLCGDGESNYWMEPNLLDKVERSHTEP